MCNTAVTVHPVSSRVTSASSQWVGILPKQQSIQNTFCQSAAEEFSAAWFSRKEAEGNKVQCQCHTRCYFFYSDQDKADICALIRHHDQHLSTPQQSRTRRVLKVASCLRPHVSHAGVTPPLSTLSLPHFYCATDYAGCWLAAFVFLHESSAHTARPATTASARECDSGSTALLGRGSALYLYMHYIYREKYKWKWYTFFFITWNIHFVKKNICVSFS